MITITPEYLAEQGFSNTIVERFWNKVFILTYDKGCWLWLAHTVKGYGEIGRGALDAGDDYAHRVSWILHKGPIPEGLWVLHHCDTPTCVNPDHLFLGTQTDNMRDCVTKNRHNPYDRSGENNHKAKLTWPDVDAIRQLAAQGVSMDELAIKYRVTHGAIWFIVKNRTWRK